MSQENDRKVGIFTDDQGNPSSMRWMSVGCVVFSAILAAWTMYAGKTEPGLDLVLVFLVAGFAPKTVQKFAEKMLPKS